MKWMLKVYGALLEGSVWGERCVDIFKILKWLVAKIQTRNYSALAKVWLGGGEEGGECCL